MIPRYMTVVLCLNFTAFLPFTEGSPAYSCKYRQRKQSYSGYCMQPSDFAFYQFSYLQAYFHFAYFRPGCFFFKSNSSCASSAITSSLCFILSSRAFAFLSLAFSVISDRLISNTCNAFSNNCLRQLRIRFG